LKVGIDGIPVTKNPPSQMWPILGYFSNLPIKNPSIFIIGAYHGKPKPEDCNEFLEDFVNELCILINVGAMYNNKHVKILLEALICDTPAKSFILNVKGHTAKNSCVRCLTVGEYENNRVYFPHLNSDLRTHDNFISYSDSTFHSGSTILTKVPQFDLINNIPFDYMHCVCIGIMKKLLMFWNGGVKRHKLALPNNLISVLDKKLNEIGQYIPVEFQRAPNVNSRQHPIRDASRWKATELRQILLYTGMVVFRDIVSKEVYEHFLELCVAIRLLSTNNISSGINNYAKSLLNHFVISFANIYGKSYMSHNIHIIQHLADDVKKFGSLNNFSAFEFESYMQPMKKKIRTGVKPLQQLIRRYSEDRIFFSKKEEPNKPIGPLNVQCKFKNRPITIDGCEPCYAGWTTEKFVLKINKADNCVGMINGDIVIIENIVTSKLNENILIIGRKFEKLEHFFNIPCLSKLLNITAASELSHLQSWMLNNIKEKMMHLPVDNKTSIIIPLLHLQ